MEIEDIIDIIDEHNVVVGYNNIGGNITLADAVSCDGGYVSISGGSGIAPHGNSGYIELKTQYGNDGIDDEGYLDGGQSGNIGIATTTGGNGAYSSMIGGAGGNSGGISLVISNGGQGGDGGVRNGNGGNAGSVMLAGGNGGNGYTAGSGSSILLYAGNGGQGNTSGNGGNIVIQSGSTNGNGTSGQIFFNLTPTSGPKTGLSGTFGQFDYNGNFITMAGIADQSYILFTPTDDFDIVIYDNISTIILDAGCTLSTGTITLPNVPIDGQIISVISSYDITSVDVQVNIGQTILNTPLMLMGGISFSYLFVSSTSTWYRIR